MVITVSQKETNEITDIFEYLSEIFKPEQLPKSDNEENECNDK